MTTQRMMPRSPPGRKARNGAAGAQSAVRPGSTRTGNLGESAHVVGRKALADEAVASWKLWLFFLSIMAPFFINLATMTLPPYRLLFLITIFPTGFAMLAGKYGRVRAVDILMIVFLLWVSISFFKVHGIARIIQQVGFTIIDTMGAYLLGRALVRNADSFIKFVRIQFVCILCLLPLALIETQTGDPIVISFLKSFVQTHPIVTYEPRLGLERAQTVFQHPIVYGIFCGVSFGLVIYTLKPVTSGFSRLMRAGVIAVSTVCSVSSGAIMALILQGIFLSYDGILRKMSSRWTLFGALFAMMYVAIDMLSNRTPFHVFVTYLALDPSTAYNRILIFDYGSRVVANNPIFGIGLNNWARPIWMSPSIDNHWLVVAMRHGYPGIILNLAIFLVFVRQVARAPLQDERNQMVRKGVLISMGGLLVSAATVFLWGPIYVWLYFFLGASVFLLEPERLTATDGPSASPGATSAPSSRYTRFAPKPAQG